MGQFIDQYHINPSIYVWVRLAASAYIRMFGPKNGWQFSGGPNTTKLTKAGPALAFHLAAYSQHGEQAQAVIVPSIHQKKQALRRLA